VISTGDREMTLLRDSISGIEKSGTPPSPEPQKNQIVKYDTVTAESVSIPVNQFRPSQSFSDTTHKNSNATAPTKTQSDSRIRITLKNGASFSGKILSENERVVRFESDGTVINIIRQLIKDIDGLAIDKDVSTKDSVLVKSSRFSDKSQSTDADSQPDLNRLFPSVQLPQGISVAQMTDSLKSKKWEQRSIHARYLAVTGQWGTLAIEPLKQLLSDTVMSKIYEPVWIDSSNVNQLLSPGDEASRALARMGDAGLKALQISASDTSALVRRRAAFGLGEISGVQAWNTLVTMLRDADRGVRAVAVTGLRSTQYSEQLIQMLKDDDSEVRTDAAFMLGKMKDKSAIRHLRSLLYDKRSIVRTQAADALVRIGTQEAILQLANATRDAAISVRENAAYALGESGDSSAVQPLIQLLKDKITSVRIASIDALAQIRDPQAIPSLYSMLNDDDPEVRERTSLALKNHTDIQSLIDALSNKSVNVKENVLYLLWLMSGQNFDMDKAAWQEWYNKSVSPVKLKK
ncbi:MAG TPA: HEAT repeat domain-containing protein, partial [Chitinispirillaceae bacterium]|nr:HEAT repeat domain-containing protein [Chitinispirillaceae bacterium]